MNPVQKPQRLLAMRRGRSFSPDWVRGVNDASEILGQLQVRLAYEDRVRHVQRGERQIALADSGPVGAEQAFLRDAAIAQSEEFGGELTVIAAKSGAPDRSVLRQLSPAQRELAVGSKEHVLNWII